MEYKVSVIIPVYNGEQYIENCIRNLDKQTLKEIEIIFINDGSEDNTKQILDNLNINRKNMKVIHQQNSGPGRARNIGIGIANGEYVSFLDIDDEQDVNMLKKMYDKITNTFSEIVVCGLKEISLNNVNIREVLFNENRILNNLEIKEEILKPAIRHGGGIFAGPCNKMYKLSFLKENNICFEESRIYGEDWFFNQRVLGKANQIAFINEPLYRYMRINENSIMNSYHPNLFDLHLNSRNFIREQMEEWCINSKDDISNWNIRFCEKVIECIANEMSSRNLNSFKEKIRRIKNIVKNSEVKIAIKENNNSFLNKMIYNENYLILSIWAYYVSVIKVNLSKIKKYLLGDKDIKWKKI